MSVAGVLDQLARVAATLEVQDGRLCVRALLEENPLTEETLELCRRHKKGLLAYLRFTQVADPLLLESTRRLARAWPAGCQLEADPAWYPAEQGVQDAYGRVDMGELEKAIASRERVASGTFDSFRKERSR